jgi:hypothetical protein
MMSTTLSRLDLVQKLMLVVIPLGLLHHADHVGRADHRSWHPAHRIDRTPTRRLGGVHTRSVADGARQGRITADISDGG